MQTTIEDTLKRATFLASHLNNCDLQCVIIAILLDLGIPVHSSGFTYLENAILIFYENPTRMLTKEVYPMVCSLYKPPASKYQVERSIRLAIADAWCDRDEKIWHCYFPSTDNNKLARPSNGEFISRIALFLRLWQGICEGGKKNESE